MANIDNKTIGIQKIKNDDVKEAVFSLLELINAKDLMKEGMKILLKPNMLSAKKPEQACTTHPMVLDAVIQWVKQFKPEKVYVSDSSGGLNPGETDKVFKSSGLREVAEKYEGVEAIAFSKTNQKIYQIPNPLVLDHISSSVLLDEVDLIINLPKIKTHQLCLVTCSIKNMFGIQILGNKAKMHLKYPKFSDFSSSLADIYSVKPPHLTIIDGYLAMEGKGPAGGDPVKMNIMVAGYNGIGLDSVVCRLMGLEAKQVTHILKAEEKGLGSTKIEEYNLVGTPIDEVKRIFKLPGKTGMSIPLPSKLAAKLSEVVFKPNIFFDVEKCTLCGTCWKNCPPNAISPPEKLDPKQYVPKCDKNTCINCYCCSELCTQDAIDWKVDIKYNILHSKLGWGIITALLGIISLIPIGIWLGVR